MIGLGVVQISQASSSKPFSKVQAEHTQITSGS